MVTEEPNDNQKHGAPERTRIASVMALSAIGVSGCVAAIPVWPTISGSVTAGLTGAALLLEIYRTARSQ